GSVGDGPDSEIRPVHEIILIAGADRTDMGGRTGAETAGAGLSGGYRHKIHDPGPPTLPLIASTSSPAAAASACTMAANSASPAHAPPKKTPGGPSGPPSVPQPPPSPRQYSAAMVTGFGSAQVAATSRAVISSGSVSRASASSPAVSAISRKPPPSR